MTSRREFLRRSTLAAVVGGWLGDGRRSVEAAQAGAGGSDGTRPAVVSTWRFGLPGNQRALAELQAGGSVLDAVEKGVRQVESDPRDSSVGLGGIPNADGVVQLDACIMGPGMRAGSVAVLEGILHPISVARRIMEVTPHVMLAGEGARRFALAQGLEAGELLTEAQRRAWERREAARRAREQEGAGAQQTETHDTLSLLVVDEQGRLAGGCSTSGWGYKMPGRVGDSPIIGSGLYVDEEVGAAGATGLGEIIMRYCGSFTVVEKMRQGMDPQTACEETVAWIVRKEKGARDLPVNFVALDRRGRYGAAGTTTRFGFCLSTPGSSEYRDARILGVSELRLQQFKLD